MNPDISKVDPTNNSEAPPDDAAPVCSKTGNESPPDKVARKRTHRGGKHKGRKSKNSSEANDQSEDRELRAIPEEEEGMVINTGKSKPTEESTRNQLTGQPNKGETIRSERRWSAGDLDEREDCERTLKIRRLIKVVWEALDELERMSDEEVVSKKSDGRFIFGM